MKKISKEEFVAAFENSIQELVKQQAEILLTMHELQSVLDAHSRACISYNLHYFCDEKKGTFSYKKVNRKKIGF